MKGQTRATSVWKEIKPFAIRDIGSMMEQAKTSSQAPGYFIILYDTDGQVKREYSFSADGLEAALAAAESGDIVWLPAGTISFGSGSYAPGSELDSGTVTAISSAGATITGLSIGSWYAVEAYGGPWDRGSAYDPDYTYNLNNGTGWSAGYLGWYIATGEVELDLPPWAAYAEAINTYYARVYFQATTESIGFRVAEKGTWYDNSGSLSWRLRAATPGATVITIPEGVEVVGCGANTIIDGNVVNNGILGNLTVTGSISGDGIYHYFAPNGQLISNRMSVGVESGLLAKADGSGGIMFESPDESEEDNGVATAPLHLAIGTLALSGDLVTIVDDSNHNAFPGACVLADGTIVVVYRDATSHNSSKGVVKMRTSTDGGATWSAEATVYEHATLDARDPCITRLSNGDLIVSIKLYDWGAGNHIRQVVISEDDGSTWGSAIQVEDGFTDYGGCSAPVVELANRDLILPTFGMDTGDSYDSSRVAISRDGGATWEYLATIAEVTRHYQEPNIVMLDNGTLLCLMRSNTTNHFYLSFSYDGGHTWTDVVDAFAAEGRPCLFRASNDALIVVYRKPSPEISVYRISLDGGWTWGDETTLDNNATHVYAATVEYSSGLLGIVFGREVSSTNADLYWQRMTASYPYALESHTHTESDITDLDHDATAIEGITVDLTGITDGQAVVYDSGEDKLIPGEVGSSGKYRQFTYIVSGGDFSFIIDDDGEPVMALQELEE